MKKVFFLMDYFGNPYAGTEGQLYALASGLNDRNVCIELAVFRSSKYVDSGLFPCRVKVLNITRMFHFMTFFRLIKLALYCRREKYELVHIFFNDASVVAPMILRLFGLKPVVSRRDMGYWYNDKLLKILRWNARFLQGCICNSHAVKKITIEKEHIAEQRVHVVYNGLPYDKTSGLSTDYCMNQIGLVANIRKIKRIEDLIKALKLVREEVPDATVVVVGEGEAEQLMALAEKYGVRDAVDFVGAQTDVSSFIRKFHVAALCSETEGLSNAIMEYMAHGKPVVCSDVGGNPELVTHGKSGYLYPVGDVASLAENILLLLQDAERTEAFGRSGYERIISQFTLENMVDNTMTVYRNVLNIP